MIRGAFPDAGDRTPAELRAAYEESLAEAVRTSGVDAAVAETGLERELVAAVEAGESPELTVEEAARLLALESDRPDRDAIAAEARDILLMGMTTAVVDVETLSSGLDGQLEPKELQQKIEGRAPMTLAEYAAVHQHLEAR